MFRGQNNYFALVIIFQASANVISLLITYLDKSDPTSYTGAGSKSYQKPLKLI